MAKVTFGATVLPKANANVTLGDSDNPWSIVSPSLTGTPTAPTATNGTNTTQIATTGFVQNTLEYVKALVYKGTIGLEATVFVLPSTHKAGWVYKVNTAGTYAGKNCEVGDMIVCVRDGVVDANGDWNVLQTNIDGAVTGPASSTTNHIATFADASGKTVKDSGFTIETSVPQNAVFTDTTYTFDGTYNASTNKAATVSTVTTAVEPKADKTNTILDTTLSRGRKANTTTGTGSVAFGNDVEASGEYSSVYGYNTSGKIPYCHVVGKFNEHDAFADYEEWVSETSYVERNKVKRTITLLIDPLGTETTTLIKHYICKIPNSDASFDASKWEEVPFSANDGRFIEIVGCGISDNSRANARALDWNGNGFYKGKLYIQCNGSSSNGLEVATQAALTDVATDLTNAVIKSSSVAIPEYGSSATYSLPGITSDHVLILWNFSLSSENFPPVDLAWSTANGTFTITNSGSFTPNDTISPIFIKATNQTATAVV